MKDEGGTHIIVWEEERSVFRISQDTATIQLKKYEARVIAEVTIFSCRPYSILDWI